MHTIARIAALFALLLAGTTDILVAEQAGVPEGHEIIYYDVPDETGRLEGGSFLAPSFPTSELRSKPATAARVTSKMLNGPPANRIDMVFVGDGYLATQLALYQAHVNIGLANLFSSEPFDSYESFFNVHVVEVISNESGVDNDPTNGIQKDTALDMGFFCSGIERLLCVNVGKAYQFANNAPDVDQVLAVANSTKYGGAGYSSSELATYSGGNGQSPEVAIHELGHSLGDLADEYFSPGTYVGAEPFEPNVSKLAATQMVAAGTKWADWMYDFVSPFDGPVNTFEGAAYYSNGIYRPSANSKMRSLGAAFNPPSAEALIKEFYKIVQPIEDSTPEGLVGETESLFVTPLHPTGHSLDVQWFLDGVPIPGATNDTLDLASQALTPGAHTVVATVVDNTPWVRDEAARATTMTESRTWQVDVTSALVDVDISCAADLPVALFINPDGSGNPLTAAQDWDGVVGSIPDLVDATITVTLTRDGVPVVGHPAEQIQMVPSAGGWTLCDGTGFADGPTDATGSATFSGPIHGGGYGAPGELVEIIVSGLALGTVTYPGGGVGLDIRVNSPDNNGDLLVDLFDLGNFAQDFYGFDERSDFYWDGVTDLIDVGSFATSRGGVCLSAKRAEPSRVADASLGLSFDRDGFSRAAHLEVGQTTTAHLILEGPAAERGATAWRASLETTSNVVIDEVLLPEGSMNLGHGADFVVGMKPRRAPGGKPLVLASLRVSVTDDSPAHIVVRTSHDDMPGFSDGAAVWAAESSAAATLNHDPVVAAAPKSLRLRNRPNPFNPATQILFDLPREGHAMVRVYDVSGRLVTEVGDRFMAAGANALNWNGNDRNGAPVVSGLYFYKLFLDGQDIGPTRKMTLLK